MSRLFIEVECENEWATIVRGPASWALCREAGRRKPAWSRQGRGWVVTAKTARRVVELAEQYGMGVVISGAKASITDAPVLEASPVVEDDGQGGLW